MLRDSTVIEFTILPIDQIVKQIMDHPHVQWKDSDGSWKTGTVVLVESPDCPGHIRPIHHVTEVIGTKNISRTFTLIKHSCDGKLEFVPRTSLRPRPMRKDYESETQSSKPST